MQTDVETMGQAQMTWRSASFTDVGKVRKCNEDAILDRNEMGIWVVADGMGGHEAGDVASQLIVKRLGQLTPSDDIAACVDAAEDMLLRINEELIQYSQTQKNGSTVGSTVVCFVAQGEIGVVLWVGDSRMYRLRGDEFCQLTVDHSEVQQLVDQGTITQEQADSSVYKNVLTRAIGAYDSVDIDVNAFKLLKGDRFILCSDGVYNELPDAQIANLLQNRSFDAVAPLVNAACFSSPARDNYSFITVTCE